MGNARRLLDFRWMRHMTVDEVAGGILGFRSRYQLRFVST